MVRIAFAQSFRPVRGALRRVLALVLAPLVVAVLVPAVGTAGPAAAQEQSLPGGFSADQVEGLEQIIRRYLLDNPEVLIESLAVYQQQQKQAEEQRRQEAAVANREALAEDPASPVLGNPEGDVLMVEFFDYRCPYCRRVADNVRRAVADDGNVRLVMKEFPILGPDSVLAARAALAAVKQGKYEAFHYALMTGQGQVTEASLKQVAREVGLDVARLERDMQDQEIDAALRRNYGLAEALGINGTPAFVIGNTVVPGAVDLKTLRRLIAEARARAS